MLRRRGRLNLGTSDVCTRMLGRLRIAGLSDSGIAIFSTDTGAETQVVVYSLQWTSGWARCRDILVELCY